MVLQKSDCHLFSLFNLKISRGDAEMRRRDLKEDVHAKSAEKEREWIFIL